MKNETARREIESLDYYLQNHTDDYSEESHTAMMMAVKALEQEPKTGHWEWMPSDDNPKLGDWHCSECRCVVVECVYKNEKRGIPLYKYCPQCGIKMVESQERSGEE